jgi:hypothetical protein
MSTSFSKNSNDISNSNQQNVKNKMRCVIYIVYLNYYKKRVLFNYANSWSYGRNIVVPY